MSRQRTLSRCPLTDAPQHKGYALEQDRQQEDEAVAEEQRRVFQHAADHDAEEIRCKGEVSRIGVAKRMRENDVGQENRREDEHTCHHIPK